MFIYVICPVRLATPETTEEVKLYVEKLERQGQRVFWPQRDVDQDDPTGENIVNTELFQIRTADEVHIFWDKNSKGSHFDLGAALILNKKIKLVKSFAEDTADKTYEKVIRIKEVKNNGHEKKYYDLAKH